MRVGLKWRMRAGLEVQWDKLIVNAIERQTRE
jgi:hypothetical protein